MSANAQETGNLPPDRLAPGRSYPTTGVRGLDNRPENARVGWNRVNKIFTPVLDYAPTLPTGDYNLGADTYGNPTFYLQDIRGDRTTDLPGLPTSFIIEQIHEFWNKKALYKKYGFTQKRGLLLYGPPGCGKSGTIAEIRKLMREHGGVVFNIQDFALASKAILTFRQVEPERPMMLVMEDFEALLGGQGSNTGKTNSPEKLALAMLDGEFQQDNVLYVATTNNPESIEDRFIRRPGRFDLIVEVHMPSQETREAYLHFTCNGALSAAEIQELAKKTDGLPLAYLREIAASHLVLGIPLEESLGRLKKQIRQHYKSRGFTVGYQDVGFSKGVKVEA